MKLRPKSSTHPQIFEHPWYEHVKKLLKKPNPPSQEAINKAQFVDKTYTWTPKPR